MCLVYFCIPSTSPSTSSIRLVAEDGLVIAVAARAQITTVIRAGAAARGQLLTNAGRGTAPDADHVVRAICHRGGSLRTWVLVPSYTYDYDYDRIAKYLIGH